VDEELDRRIDSLVADAWEWGYAEQSVVDRTGKWKELSEADTRKAVQELKEYVQFVYERRS